MVRHNYPNCTACHVSPTGGGVLTQYGRELSRAILPTFGTENENESKFAYGIVTPPTWLDLMGMYRSVYAYQNTPYVSEGKYIYMQGDIEGAAHFLDHFYADVAIGYQNPPGATDLSDHVISRRFYLNYRPTDELSFRAGRFYPAFGINTPDHVIPTKRDLGWDEGQETDNIEAAWIGETYNLFATADLGRLDTPSAHREQGFALTPSVAVVDHYKIGLSYFYGNGLDTTRNVIGPWGILGFTPRFFLLTELYFQQQSSKTGAFDSRWGAVNYQRLDYELIQGLHVYATQDYSRLRFSDARSLANSFGAGLQWFPRPHFEINLQWQKQKAAIIGSDYSDFAWVMLNVYI
jgi:hypothetical protein